MKSKIITILLLTILKYAFGQGTLTKYFITYSAAITTGAIDGTIESLNYHYDNGFSPRFKNLNHQFWNPALSWRNKYKDGVPSHGPKFFGSTNALCFATDGYHLLRTTKRTIETSTIVYYIYASSAEKKLRNEND